MILTVQLKNEAVQCMRCIHRSKAIQALLDANLKFKDLALLILDEAATCRGKSAFQADPEGRDFVTGDNNERISTNRNPFEKDERLAVEDGTYDAFWVGMPARSRCPGFEREMHLPSIIQFEKAERRNRKNYYILDNFIRNGHLWMTEASRFLRNLAMIQWPSHGRFILDNFRDGRVFWKYNKDGWDLSIDKKARNRGKTIRHRKVIAMIVKAMLELGSKDEQEKLLLWLMCSPRDSIAASVWYWVTKGDHEVRMDMALIVDEKYSGLNKNAGIHQFIDTREDIERMKKWVKHLAHTDQMDKCRTAWMQLQIMKRNPGITLSDEEDAYIPSAARDELGDRVWDDFTSSSIGSLMLSD